MPISDDEFDYQIMQEQPQSTMSKAELRKTHKPIMEKRRRARINHCLNEIKSLILEAMNKDPARHSKLEKADILEMAVKHLQNVQRQQMAVSLATDNSILRKFKTGFNECATEIDRYISQLDGVDAAMKQRISAHLQKCISGIEQVAQFNIPGFQNLPFLNSSPNLLEQNAASSSGDQNNNPASIHIPQGLQLIPSRLPTGELALLVPNSSNLSYFPGLSNPIHRPSAFATVIPSGSPPLSPEDPRASSPQGFRPVKPRTLNEQVAQVSSTSLPLEVKTIKFPINKLDKSPRKPSEPLCIITNQSERFKQAQTKPDSAFSEENIIPRGIKRKAEGPLGSQGLLTVATPEVFQPRKLFKYEGYEHEPSTSRSQDQPPSGSAGPSNESMWRPW